MDRQIDHLHSEVKAAQYEPLSLRLNKRKRDCPLVIPELRRSYVIRYKPRKSENRVAYEESDYEPEIQVESVNSKQGDTGKTSTRSNHFF